MNNLNLPFTWHTFWGNTVIQLVLTRQSQFLKKRMGCNGALLFSLKMVCLQPIQLQRYKSLYSQQYHILLVLVNRAVLAWSTHCSCPCNLHAKLTDTDRDYIQDKLSNIQNSVRNGLVSNHKKQEFGGNHRLNA